MSLPESILSDNEDGGKEEDGCDLSSLEIVLPENYDEGKESVFYRHCAADNKKNIALIKTNMIQNRKLIRVKFSAKSNQSRPTSDIRFELTWIQK
jgi:hypothetical protein